MLRWGLAAALVAAALAWISYAFGFATLARVAGAGWWALPGMVLVHMTQLGFSALAWRLVLGAPAVSRAAIFRFRWVREGVNSLLPVAQLGGQVVGARLLVRAGVGVAAAAAGTILDVLVEVGAQLVFTCAGIGLLAVLGAGLAWRDLAGGGVLATALGVAGFFLVQRLGILRLVEAAVNRLALQLPGFDNWSLDGLHAAFSKLQGDRRAVLGAFGLQLLSWSLGGLEVYLALGALGHGVGLVHALTIESLGMAARSAGFVVPGALGVQEGGFVLVAGMFGVPAEVGLAVSLLKRAREVIVGLPALITLASPRSA